MISNIDLHHDLGLMIVLGLIICDSYEVALFYKTASVLSTKVTIARTDNHIYLDFLHLHKFRLFFIGLYLYRVHLIHDFKLENTLY